MNPAPASTVKLLGPSLICSRSLLLTARLSYVQCTNPLQCCSNASIAFSFSPQKESQSILGRLDETPRPLSVILNAMERKNAHWALTPPNGSWRLLGAHQ